MKKILTGALSLVLFFGAAQAQQDSSRHFNGGKDRMAKELNLSADQQKKLQSINQDERKEMKALRDKYQSQKQAVLTPDQRQKMEAWKAQHKGQRDKMAQGKGQFKRHMMGHRNAELQKELNLTQDQKDQISKMRADVRSQMESIRNDQSLTQDQKKEKVHSLMKDQREKFKSVLTKEQMEKWQSLQKEHEPKNSK